MNIKDLRKNELYTYRANKGIIKGVCFSDSFVLDDSNAYLDRRQFLFKSCVLNQQDFYYSHLLSLTEVDGLIDYPNYTVWSLRYFLLTSSDFHTIYWISKERSNEFFDVLPMGENIRDFLLNSYEDELGLLIEQMERLKIDEIIKGIDDNAIVSINKVIYHAKVRLRIITSEISPNLLTAFQRKISGVIQ